MICHSDAGSRYTLIVCTERFSEIGALPSMGLAGYSFDTALAETVNGACKHEVIHGRGPWRDLDHVEIETLNSVHSFDHDRLHESLGVMFHRSSTKPAGKMLLSSAKKTMRADSKRAEDSRTNATQPIGTITRATRSKAGNPTIPTSTKQGGSALISRKGYAPGVASKRAPQGINTSILCTL